jgi:predicted transcriptional regulator YheO
MMDSGGLGGMGTKEQILGVLKMVGESVSAALGDWCEVLVHDLSDLDHSIVWIGGNLTGRKVGGHMTDLGLAQLKSGQFEPLVNYTSYTEDGKTLKCTSMFILDDRGAPVAGFCVNLNVTPFILFDRFLQTLAYHGQGADAFVESFSQDMAQMVETMIAECAYQIGKPLSMMTKGDRVRVVNMLEERGAFQLRKSVPLVAKRLGVTEKTIYNYLAELEVERRGASVDREEGAGGDSLMSRVAVAEEEEIDG